MLMDQRGVLEARMCQDRPLSDICSPVSTRLTHPPEYPREAVPPSNMAPPAHTQGSPPPTPFSSLG